MRWKILLLILLAACSSAETPSGVLPVEKMKPVMFDIIRADEFASNYIASDSSKNINEERIKLYEKVFSLHKVTSEQFFNSFKYYQQNPDVHKQLFDSLVEHGKKIRLKNPDLKPLQELNTN